VARTAFMAAFTRRLRPAMSRNTRNATPIFRKLDGSFTASILSACSATMAQTRCYGEPFGRARHLIS